MDRYVGAPEDLLDDCIEATCAMVLVKYEKWKQREGGANEQTAKACQSKRVIHWCAARTSTPQAPDAPTSGVHVLLHAFMIHNKGGWSSDLLILKSLSMFGK
jgi:hypothetical protein